MSPSYSNFLYSQNIIYGNHDSWPEDYREAVSYDGTNPLLSTQTHYKVFMSSRPLCYSIYDSKGKLIFNKVYHGLPKIKWIGNNWYCPAFVQDFRRFKNGKTCLSKSFRNLMDIFYVERP